LLPGGWQLTLAGWEQGMGARRKAQVPRGEEAGLGHDQNAVATLPSREDEDVQGFNNHKKVKKAKSQRVLRG